jgi:leucyl/phenylalanyl-tRNA--protein transferase
VIHLSTDLLLAAYAQGIFPMSVGNDKELAWFSPDPRTIIPLDEGFHIPKSLARTLKKDAFEIRINFAFESVLRACATVHGSTWISKDIHEAYLQLHRKGHAHSVECWENTQLVGGLYGVAIGGAFCGESMFHHVTDASKIALVKLVERLRKKGFHLLDTQWITPHLKKFGAREIPRAQYMRLLRAALKRQPNFRD